MFKCCRQLLKFEDVYDLPPHMKSKALVRRFERLGVQQHSQLYSRGQYSSLRDQDDRRSLRSTIFHLVKWTFLRSSCARIICVAILFIQPFILR